MKNSRQIAKEFGKTQRDINFLALRYGIGEKVGWQRLFTPKDIEKLKSHMNKSHMKESQK